MSLLKSHAAAHTGGAKNVPLRILVFALYKKEATRLEQTIRRANFKVAGLHGDMGQKERMAALEGFVSGEVGVLVATGQSASLSVVNLDDTPMLTFARVPQMLPREVSISLMCRS